MSMALPSERSFEPLPVSEERSDDRSSDISVNSDDACLLYRVSALCVRFGA